MFLSFISISLALLINYYFKALLDNNNILFIFIVFSVIVLIKELIDYVKNLVIIKLENNIDEYITINTHNKLLSLPYYYFNSRATGDVLSRIYDLDYVKELFIKVPIFLFIDVILFILLTVILININRTLFLMFFIICICYFLILILFNKKNKDFIRIIQENTAVNNKIIVENIKSINTIKNLNISNFKCNIYNNIYEKYIKSKEKYAKTYNIEMLIKNIIIFIGINVILYIGIIFIEKGSLKLSNLIFFNTLMLYYIDVIKSICDINPLLKKGINALKRIEEIYLINSNNAKDINISKYDIKIKNMSFSYDGYNNILSNVNLNILENEKIVVIGSSGSGKSTLFKLINKTYEVGNDKIFLADIDINKINVTSHISYVSQEESLFNDTLYNNLVIDKEYKIDYINKTMRLTRLDKVLEHRKLNLNSIIEEEGTNFSKGERQKIILTRVLLKNNKVLILDESLNGVEENEEYNILNRILIECKNKTIVYITHRKKCIKLFDRVLNFNKLKEEK